MKHTGMFAVFAALVIAGCAQDSSESEVSADIEIWQDELPIRDPWLRDQLPDDVLMYMRVPSLFGLFATPKGNVLDTALRSRTNVENVQKIRTGIADNVLAMMPAVRQPAAHAVRAPCSFAHRDCRDIPARTIGVGGVEP